MEFSKDMNEFKRESTFIYLFCAVFHFSFAFLMVSLGVSRIDIEMAVFNPDLRHYTYADHQYWLHLIAVISYVPFVAILIYRGLNVRKLFFTSKIGGGNTAFMFAVGGFMTYYLFVGFDGGAGRMTLAMQNSLVGTYLFSQCLLMGATGPIVWGLMWCKWKLGERHGKSTNRSG